MSILDALPHTCEAKRRIRTKDTFAGSKDSFTTLFSGRACWRQPASDSEITEYQKRSINVTHAVYFTADPGLDNSCILVIDGDTMEVHSASHPDSSVGLGILYRLMVELGG